MQNPRVFDQPLSKPLQKAASIGHVPVDTELDITEQGSLIDNIIDAVPANKKKYIDKDFIQELLASSEDPTQVEGIIQNFVSFTHILGSNKRYRLSNYLNAIKYVSFIIWGFKRKEAFAKVFPEKYNQWLADEVPDNQVESMISSFAYGEIVVSLMKQAHTPAWLMHQSTYHESIVALKKIALDEQNVKPHVRVDALGKLIEHLAKPEDTHIHILNTDTSASDTALDIMRRELTKLAQMRIEDIGSGRMSTSDAAARRIIEPEIGDVEGESEAVTDADFEDIPAKPAEQPAKEPAVKGNYSLEGDNNGCTA